ncbi:MAG: ribose-5-phosphate isomerase RpiA, partial [Bacteroidetes bacterium]
MNSKAKAGQAAAQLVTDGMRVGLGTGSTAYFMIQALGEAVARGLSFVGVPTSRQTAKMASELGIQLREPHEVPYLDLTIDGADEFDPQLNLIKGGGGALFREKMVASLSRRMVVITDARKRVPQLGAFPLPVEVVPFGWQITAQRMGDMGLPVQRREGPEGPFLTDNGNYILDCNCKTIPDPISLHQQLKALIGVVETGLFCGMATEVILGHEDGRIEHILPEGHG